MSSSVQMAGLVSGALTLVLSFLLPFAVRPLLVRLGIMDVPNERSSHERPVLRGLGLAVLIAIAVGGGSGVLLLGLGGWTLLVVVLASVAASLLGLREDFKGLSVRARSIALLTIALAVPLLLLFVRGLGPADDVLAWGDGTTGSIIDPIPLWLEWTLIPYAVLFISAYINVANFMDGLNGISGFHGAIAGLTFAIVGATTGLAWLFVFGLVLAAGFAGFLPWNLTKPGAFLGDVGSYLLGGATAIASYAALMAGVPLLATIGPMVIYFGDVGVTLVKRVRSGHKWDEPHKEHVYQRIQQLGYSHVQASAMAAGCTLLTSILGLLSIGAGPLATGALLAGGIAVLLLYLALPRVLPRRVR